MPYSPMTDEHKEAMLRVIGVDSIDELFEDIPKSIRMQQPLNLPAGLAEADVRRHVTALANENVHADAYPIFLGAGAYDHLIPAAVGHLVSRSEFYTSYTPYQPEMTQGVLQATYEYQTLIARLTGMDLANASVYDGATSLAEAALVACAQKRKEKIIVPTTVHPEYRQVVHTYLRHQDLEVVEVAAANGLASVDAVQDLIDDNTAAIVVQQPNFFGRLEDVHAFGRLAEENNVLFIAVVTDPLTLGVLEAPGAYGAHIAVGEGQSLGNPISFGGPHLGFFAAKDELVRRIPGRIAGATKDRDGETGYVLTLQTREQHIRRERATSNICTNQALNALTAAVYLTLLGKQGVQDVAHQSLQKAHYAQKAITRLPGFDAVWDGPFFHEFAVRTPVAPEELSKGLLERGIIGGLPLGRFYPELEDSMLFCVTEARTRAEIDALVAALEELT